MVYITGDAEDDIANYLHDRSPLPAPPPPAPHLDRQIASYDTPYTPPAPTFTPYVQQASAAPQLDRQIASYESPYVAPQLDRQVSSYETPYVAPSPSPAPTPYLQDALLGSDTPAPYQQYSGFGTSLQSGIPSDTYTLNERVRTPVQTSTPWWDSLPSVVGNVAGGVGDFLQTSLQAQNPGIGLQRSGGENTGGIPTSVIDQRALTDLTSGNALANEFGLHPENLPYGLNYVTDAINPATLLTAGAGDSVPLIGSAFKGGLARRAAGEIATQAGGMLASDVANERLPQDMPGRQAAVIGAGLLGGGLTYAGIEHGPGAVRAATRGLDSVFGGEGALSGEQGSVLLPGVSRSAKTPITFPEPQPAAELGDAGIAAALARKGETTAEPGLLSGFKPARKLGALVNPSVDLDRGVHIANQADAAVKADLGTRFASTRSPLLDEVKDAFRVTPEYVGPAENKIKGTFIDIAENPHDYLLTPQQKTVLAKVAARDTANVNLVRSQFNADVGLYSPKNPDGIYLPHVNTNEDLIQQGVRTEASLSAPRVAKERVWDTARARAAHDPRFVPETEAARLLEAHDNALASMAGKETFKAGAGGMNKADAMAEAFPALAKQMDSLKKRLTSLKATAGRLDQKTNDAIDTFLKSGQGDDDLTALQDSLRPQVGKSATGQVGPNFGKDRTAINAEIRQVKAQLDDLRPKWRNANLTDRGFVQNRTTFQYHTPEASQSIDRLKELSNGRIVDSLTNFSEKARAGVLSSDASPLTIQGQLSLARDPVSTVITLAKRIGRGTSLEDITRAEPEMVSRYTQARMRSLGEVAHEFSPQKSWITKLPRVGPKLAAAEERMFGLVQRVEYETWKRTVNLLEKTHPDLTQAQIDHEAANALSKTNPSLSSVERGVSPARGKIERSLVTSTSFLASPAMVVKDAASGIVKILAHGGNLSAARGRELVAIKHLLTIAGAIEAISLTSAAMNAEHRGLSPEDAVKRALTPGDKSFMAMQIGGMNIPIGGPYRSAINGLLPRKYKGQWEAPDLARFALSKAAPVPGISIDLLRNLDYRGGKIRSGGGWEQTLQALEYIGEGVLPLTLGAIPEGIRTGQSGKEIAQNVLTQAAGTNISATTPYEARDIYSRKNFGGRDYSQLNRLEKQQVTDALGKYTSTNPTIAAEQASRQQATDALRSQNVIRQQQIDELGPGAQWRDQYHQLQQRVQGQYEDDRARNPYTGPASTQPMDKAMDEWSATIDANTHGVTVDWDAVDAWRAQNPDKSALVDEYMSGKKNNDLTPMVTQYHDVSKQLSDAGLFTLGDQIWGQIGPQLGDSQYPSYYDWRDATVKDILRQVNAQGVTGALADKFVDKVMRDMPEYKLYTKYKNVAETVWIQEFPQLAAKAYEWGYISPTKQEAGIIAAAEGQ